MAESTAITSVAKAREQLDRLKHSLRNAREQGQRIAEETVSATLVTAGGAISGALHVKMPVLPGTKIETDMALGAALTAASIFGFMGRESGHYANCIGQGLLAAGAARHVEAMLKK